MTPRETDWKPVAWDAKLWTVARGSPSFPEQQLSGWPPAGSTDTGVCFSGGGSRAMSAAMGQMRGLRALGLLGKARYMSCVSGGSWAGTIYTFVPVSTDDEVLLGDYLEPKEIQNRDSVSKPLNARCLCEPATLSLSEPMKHFWEIGVPHDQLWLRTIGYRFLRPFGGGEWGLNQIFNPFTWNAETRDSLLKRNGPAFKKDDIYVVEERESTAGRRPFLIDMATLIRPPNHFWTHEYLLPVEFTAYYSGIPGAYTVTHDGHDVGVGGGFVESFAFGRPLYKTQPASGETVWTTIGRPFNLSDMTGTSSAFFAADAAKVDLGSTFDPSYTYYPIPLNDTPPYGESVELTGDGGNLDNTGILPLLLRRVGNIIAFVNSDQKTEWSDLHGVPIVAGMIPPLFGYEPYDVLHAGGYEAYPADSTDPWSILKVFKGDQFKPLITKLRDAYQKGMTAMWKDQYHIASDNKLGIDYGGSPVTILWVYNNPVNSWTGKIESRDVRDDIKEGETGDHGPLPNFPNYSTAFEDVKIWDPLTWDKLANLTAYQVTMLADLSHWNITSSGSSMNGPSNKDLVTGMFSA